MTKFVLFSLSIFLLLINPIIVNSAEILQINSANTVLIGDQNRNILVNLFCIEVDASNDEYAKELLQKNFPRGTKVKIKPYGKIDNNLIAKVYNLKNNNEMTELLISKKLTIDNCDN